MSKQGIMFTADLHLRDDTPQCRTDDFVKTQWAKMEWVISYAKRNGLYWVDCGDIFHKAQPNYGVVQKLIKLMKDWGTYIDVAICGNHDMPAHNFDQLLNNSAWGLLYQAGCIRQWLHNTKRSFSLECEHFVYDIWGCNYTEDPVRPDLIGPPYIPVLIMHDMFFPKNNTIPNVEGYIAEDFAGKWQKWYPYIFTGHNHKAFGVYIPDASELYNVGSLTRQSADMAEHEPRILVLQNCCVKSIPIPDLDKKAVSRAHIDKREAVEDNINSFVESLGSVQETTLNFEGNVQIIIKQSNASNGVKQKVQGALE